MRWWSPYDYAFGVEWTHYAGHPGERVELDWRIQLAVLVVCLVVGGLILVLEAWLGR